MPKAAGGGVGQMRVRVGELRDKMVGNVRMLEEDNVWVRGHIRLCNGITVTSHRRFRDFEPSLVGGEKGPAHHLRTTSTHTSPHEFHVNTST